MDLRAALERHGVGPEAERPIAALLEALAREPDPHTTVPAAEAVDVHVADSLAALLVPELRAANAIADIGAGAGFPGLPLATALPRARVDLIESAGRKVALVDRLIEAAGLTNARAVHARAEEWAAAEGRAAYEAVCARAVGPLALVAEYAAPLLSEGGVLIAWKGRRDSAEDGAGTKAAAQLGLEPAEVLAVTPYPGSRERHLHLYRKSSPTPPGFPRRPGIARKRPLA
jgi:16S rRNA (guanine527-N7)-methyltransferase